MVLVIHPVNGRVKWHQVGSWIRQHDPDFKANGRIALDGEIVWEYINRYDDEVAVVTQATRYPDGYFDTVDWTCGD